MSNPLIILKCIWVYAGCPVFIEEVSEKKTTFFLFIPLSNSTQALDFTDIKNTSFHKMISTFRLSLSPVLKKERNTNPCPPANTAWPTLRPLKPNLQEGNRA